MTSGLRPIKTYLKFEGDKYSASALDSVDKENLKAYLRGNLGVQALNGVVVSVLFFDGKYPKVMRKLLSKGMSAEALKKLLRQQGGKEIGTIPIKTLSKYSNGYVTAVFGSYQYAFEVEDDDGEKFGLRTMEISEYLDDY